MGWLTGWDYRKKITISGVSGAGVDYSVKLKIGESSGSSGADFHLEGHSDSFPAAKNQGGDLRFTTDDGTTECPFGAWSVTGAAPNRVAEVWVKVPADLETDADIYCYYGNSQAADAGSLKNALLWYDDFAVDSLQDYDVNLIKFWPTNTTFGPLSYDPNEQAVYFNTGDDKDASLSPKGISITDVEVSSVVHGLCGWPNGFTVGHAVRWDNGYDYRGAVSGVRRGSSGCGWDYTCTYNSPDIHLVRPDSFTELVHGNFRLERYVDYTLTFRCWGANLSMTVDGGDSISVTDNTLTGAGRIASVATQFRGYLREFWARKYVGATEPAFSAAGAEEDSGVLVEDVIDLAIALSTVADAWSDLPLGLRLTGASRDDLLLRLTASTDRVADMTLALRAVSGDRREDFGLKLMTTDGDVAEGDLAMRLVTTRRPVEPGRTPTLGVYQRLRVIMREV